MKKLPLSLLFSDVFLAVCLSIAANAQTTTSGGLSGIVTDPAAAIVPHADVEIRDTAKGTIQTTKTDRSGGYQFFFLEPGRYTLTVGCPGFRNEMRVVDVLLGPPLP